MKSIQTKFIVLILSCVILSSVVIGGAGILNAKEVIDEGSAQIMNQNCSRRAGELDGLLERIEQSVKTLSAYTLEQLESVERLKADEAYRDEYTKRLEEVAVNAANNTEGAVAVYVRFNPSFTPPTSGLFWSKTERSGTFQQLVPTDFSNYNPSDVEHVGWYYIPVKQGKPTWMTPYFNDNIATRMISYVVPIYKENETIGIVGMDIDFTLIEKYVEETRIYTSGYAFLVDAANNVVFHKDLPPNTSMASTDSTLIPVVNELQNGTSGSSLFEYTWQGKQKKMAFRTLKNDMRLAITAPISEIDQVKNRMILQTVIAMMMISAISVFFTIVLTRKIVRPLKELNLAAQKIAAGDLNVSLSYQTKDEVGTLADSFQQTVNHLQKYIKYINGLAYRDSLTGAKNKAAYQDAGHRIEEQMHLGRPEFAVIVLDINDLKQINDTYGHDFGDMMIIDACKLMCKVFRHSPVYRVGGDEFVIILENADYTDYQELLMEFQKEMEAYNKNTRTGSYLSIARGIAIYQNETDLVFANVFKRADEAMYQNKAAMKEREKKSI